MTPRDRYFLVGIGLFYFLANALHGVVHFSVPVGLTPFQWAFVLIVASSAPAVAIGLIWIGRTTDGLPLFTLSMAGAFLFGVYFHFLVENPDNVGAVQQAWAGEFSLTAILIAVSSVVGAVYGGWLWMVDARAPKSGFGTAGD